MSRGTAPLARRVEEARPRFDERTGRFVAPRAWVDRMHARTCSGEVAIGTVGPVLMFAKIEEPGDA